MSVLENGSREWHSTIDWLERLPWLDFLDPVLLRIHWRGVTVVHDRTEECHVRTEEKLDASSGDNQLGALWLTVVLPAGRRWGDTGTDEGVTAGATPLDIVLVA